MMSAVEYLYFKGMEGRELYRGVYERETIDFVDMNYTCGSSQRIEKEKIIIFFIDVVVISKSSQN